MRSFDALGSTLMASNGNGTISAANAYDAWGSVLASYGGGTEPYEYVGELGYYAHNAGVQGPGLGNLLQLGVRFYDPEIGRFTQRDPVWAAVEETSYVYASGIPTFLVDPSGEFAWGPIIASMKSRVCRSFVACVGAALGRGLYELVKDAIEGKIHWGNIGCRAACACVSAGPGAAIPKDLLRTIFGASMGTAMLGPCCTDWCNNAFLWSERKGRTCSIARG